jgi:hypothetical protein
LCEGDPLFQGLPEQFVSPFPSRDAQLSEKFQALTGDAGAFSAAQATAWQNVTRLSFKALATSEIAGGLRTEWIPKLVEYKEGGLGGPILQGIFADVSFPSTTSSKDLSAAALQVGFSIALDLVSAVPIVGGALRAAVSIGKFFYRLYKGGPEEAELVVPWREYSRDTDEDIINAQGGILKGVMPSVDWSSLWFPPLSSQPGWRLEKTSKGGETRAFGPFTTTGQLSYAGYGAMPGTERVVDIVQVAQTWKGTADRIDAITNIGDFYPSTGQWATSAWQMVQRMGGSWMYNVRPGELDLAWKAYWDAYFGEGLEQLRGLKRGTTDALFLAKAIAKFLTFKDVNWWIGLPDQYLAQTGNLDSFIDDTILSAGNKLFPGTRYYTPHRLIGNALETLRERQMAALARTVVCAYIRPDPVGKLPAHAAFLDSSPATDPAFKTWGEQLAARCREVREILLGHDARCTVSLDDAFVADPAFAERIRDSRGMTCVTKVAAKDLLPGGRTPRRALPPQGGAPFGDRGGAAKRRGMGTGAKVGIAAAGLAAAGYGARRLGWI